MDEKDREADVTAIINAISRTVFSATSSDVAKHALLLVAACVFVFVLSLTYGLDLSPGLF
ncbi:hypothetical protein IVA98_15625 [Bradyrhizobium sp. 160]|uniref:hypothetical protein n=1 Tax=unclassified Bradyrhizobium TaxID=2631580 RepID=UPI001FF75D11|nr:MULTISPECIES: hypothetical protein [unclassified Bradyrhizobium]MCK1544224.1 hypothetical protein [Bradyrhizobium sp. 179]MCK1624572.1 hypothetical protein [Bradyrhizobium sp. 160]